MSWFTNLFREKKQPKKERFEIIHYPRTRKYVVKHKGKYLKTTYLTGIVYLESFFDVVDFYNSIESAESSIELFKEQKYNKNIKKVKTIE